MLNVITVEDIPPQKWVHQSQIFYSGEEASTRYWANKLLIEFGPLAFRVKREFLGRRKRDRIAANVWLRKASDHLRLGNPTWRYIYGPAEIDDLSKWCAKTCLAFTSPDQVMNFCSLHGLPIFTAGTSDGLLRRSGDWQCWRKTLRKVITRFRDQLMRILGFVNKRCQVYCSDHVVEWHNRRDQATRELLNKITARSDEGDEMTLLELHELSIANPKNRFAELMVRCKGNEEWATEQGQIAIAITLTTSSRFHCCHYKTGQINDRFNGSTPKEANDHLVNLFSKIRTSLGNQGVKFTGYRVVEAHHDGTPHWHLMLFIDPSAEELVRRTFTHYALLEHPNEPGAQKHRIKFELIRSEQGSATGYMTKYIAKNIAGAANQPDLLGNEAPIAAQRVIAWAKTWGIRQFQFFGDSSVTIWREYRRIHDNGTVVESSPHFDAWKAASIDSNWASFKSLMGSGRTQDSILTRCDRIHAITGECTPPTNLYGEPKALAPIEGIERDGVVLITRTKYWTTERGQKPTQEETKPMPQQQSASQQILTAKNPLTGAQRSEKGAIGAPWTCVNNCTEYQIAYPDKGSPRIAARE